MGQSNWVHLENCNVMRTTDAALYVEYDGAKYWLPISQISEGEKYKAGDKGVTISCTEWIIEQKGITVED